MAEQDAHVQQQDSRQERNVIQRELMELVQRGTAGDRAVLPALRALLDQTPTLWEEARSLAMQVERAWLRALAGENLVSQEILERQLGMMKDQLAGPEPTPLEQLLVERIVVCWLQVQQAELRAAGRLGSNGMVLSHAEEYRLNQVHRRFLMAVKSLAQVQKLLRPGAAIQVNIAQQQVNVS
jgi:hypothetical protein